jgi:PKD repeat protein
VLVAAPTDSTNLTTTANAISRTAPGSGGDIYVARVSLSPGAEAINYATYLGASNWDAPEAIADDGEGGILICGYTWSMDFASLTTPDAAQGQQRGESDDFLAHIGPEGALEYLTLLGGSGPEHAGDFLLLPDRKVVLTSWERSSIPPAPPGDPSPVLQGVADASLLVLDLDPHSPSYGKLLHSTLVGSGGNDFFRELVPGPTPGTLIAAGFTTSFDLPAAEGAFQPSPGGHFDVLLCQLDIRYPAARLAAIPSPGRAPVEVCADASSSTTPGGTDPLTYAWDFGEGSTAGPGFDSVVCPPYTDAGTYTVRVTVTNKLGLTSSAVQTISVGCPTEELAPWIAADIGAVAFAGGVRRDGGADCLELCGRGKALTGREDALFFLHQAAATAEPLTVRIERVDAKVSGAAAGLMVRESLEAGARYAAVVVEPNGRVRLRHRLESGGGTTSDLGPLLSFPVELRLERDGETFIGYAQGVEVGRVALEALASDAAVGGLAANTSASVCDLDLAAPATLRFQRGDCNDDGEVDISDAVCILGWLFLGLADPGCVAVTDTNGDARPDISDATYLLNHLFLGGTAPVAPYPGCGPGTLPADEGSCATPPACP